MKKIAFVLLIATINVIVGPFLLAGRSAAAPLNVPDGPTEFIRRINLTTNDLVYSSTTGRIYASLPSLAGSNGNSIAAIDPATGAITSTTFIGSEPNKLALSDDGHSLYVTLDGAAAIRRFDALTNTPGLQFSTGTDPFFGRGRYDIADIAVAPANPGTIAVARQFSNVSPAQAGVAIFDDGVQRPLTSASQLSGPDSIAFSATATKLYGHDPSGGGIQTLTIMPAGVSVTSTALPNVFGSIKFSNGLIFTSAGHVVNPDTSTLVGTFTGAFAPTFVPDPTVGRAYYLQPGPTDGTLTLKVFDINTFLPLGSLTISGVAGGPTSLLRWGPNGLAFRTTFNQLFIIQTSLIPSATPIPTPTPTPSPSPSPSPSPAAAFIREMTLSANDLVYNQGTQKIFASVPSNEGSTGNSIAEIDPVLGSVTNQTFVGSEPNLLAQADDGATLYVGLDGAASIRRYDMLTHTAGQQFFVGRDSFFGLYSFSDIAVSPGNPSTIAVARQHTGVSPPQAGVAIFDDGVMRPKTGPPHVDGSDSLAFASPSLLYGASFTKLSKMSVDGSGVTVTGTAPFFSGGSMVLANNLLYGASGQVINPTTGALVGTFFGAFTGTPTTSHVIDVANGRAFYLISGFNFGGGFNAHIIAYDLNTFLQVGGISITGVTGFPKNLIRWGANGLAFSTSNRQVFLIETALVNASVPVASPTPTPSPTPSPTPPYIPTFLRRVELPSKAVVYSEATQALYASVPGSAGPNGNSITKITPGTGEVGPSVFVGSEPNAMAISSDGQTIWTHLNGANAARRFDVLTGTAGLQFNTGSLQPPADMEVVPGSPQALVLSRTGNGGLAVFDNGVQRPNTATMFGPIEFGANASTLYGSSVGTLTKFLVDANGVTQSTVTNGFWDNTSAFEFSDGLVYSNRGVVADPESGELKGTFQLSSFSPAMAVDGPNKRTFFAFRNGVDVIIATFDSNTFTFIGAVTLPWIGGDPMSLVRWGTNGLAFTTIPTTFPGASRVVIVQTELVSKAAPIPTGIQFETDRFFVREGTPTISIKVIRTGDVSGTASINFATSDGNATAGADYTAVSGTLTFAPGELSKNISIPIINDNLFETGDETFNITLSNPIGGAVLTSPNSGTINLSDDDFQPNVSVAQTARIAEGDSGTQNIAVNVTLSTPSVQTVTVDYATSNGTAVAGSDYVASSGTVTIPAGSTTATINVPINGDTTIELTETFNITLSNATNVAFISNPVVSVFIVNDDAALQFNSAAVSVNESAGFVNVTVTRVGDLLRASTVRFSTTDTAGLQNCQLANGKASERCDYATVVGSLRFGIGETTKTFTIPIVNDAFVEG
ncbi:MAG TPA: Calx-beta domain-containing protein, partial [Pyrinomonadaceae bacterium]|nr:Calx-beta domain-containing protein [Pyrinomonadaceae bacterium]